MLMLIQLKNYKDMIVLAISIHLMLMLIPKQGFYTLLQKYFNTSHVNVNPLSDFSNLSAILHFNTSHVNVNLVVCEQRTHTIKSISIHLMLMLILIFGLAVLLWVDFNTSHVNVNRKDIQEA